MENAPMKNRQWVLNQRPNGAPTPEDFKLVESDIPNLNEGEVLLKTRYLSLDPYMRGRMSDAPSYAPSLNIGEVIVGGTVSEVVESRNPKFAKGDRVLAGSGWQEYEVSDGTGLMSVEGLPEPSYALSLMGMPGFTAYHGLLNIGEPKPGETVVVASASGAVGSVVGQIAKLKGCRVVGITSGGEKQQYVKETLGFDESLDRHSPNFEAELAKAAPEGIDVYYENVGGAVFDAVLPLLNDFARIPVCGVIAHYNATELPEGPDRVPMLAGMILRKRIRMQGFIIMDHYETGYAPFAKEMTQWLQAGQIRIKEDRVQGFEAAPEAFIGLLEGKNFGKVVVDFGA